MRNQYKVLSDKYSLLNEEAVDTESIKNSVDKAIVAIMFEDFAKAVKKCNYVFHGDPRTYYADRFLIEYVESKLGKIPAGVSGNSHQQPIPLRALALYFLIAFAGAQQYNFTVELYKTDARSNMFVEPYKKDAEQKFTNWRDLLKEAEKSKDIYNKGTQDTGGDWDISGL